MNIQNQIKNLRIKIDAVSQLVDTNDLKSAETVKCHNELLMAKCFLGKILGELGEPTPYANDGKRKTVADIEPAADVADPENVAQWPVMPDDWRAATPSNFELDPDVCTLRHISALQRVDFLRQSIGELIDKDLMVLSNNFLEEAYTITGGDLNDAGIRISLYEAEVMSHLCRARFWLGFDLQRIRETTKSDTP